jgi:HSP20 family protein
MPGKIDAQRGNQQPYLPALHWWNALPRWPQGLMREPFLGLNTDIFSPLHHQNVMNQLLGGMLRGGNLAFTPWLRQLEPHIDVVETRDGYAVKAELQGIDPSDVKVSTDGNALVISAEKSEENEDEDENYLHRESMQGAFSRTIPLPPTADASRAQAHFDRNVLVVEVPRKSGAAARPSRAAQNRGAPARRKRAKKRART